MNPFEESIGETLKQDPFLQAEKITGKSYKEDKQTEALSLFLHLQKVQDLDSLLSITNDTRFSNTIQNYLRICKDIGFDVVYQESFHSDKWNKDDILYVLYHKDGILLKFDTFGDNVN